MMEKYKVAVMECSSYDLDGLMQVIDSGVELAGGWERYVQPGSKVLLKVNMIGPEKPETAVTTHPEMLRAVIRLLKRLGCTVWVGDSSGGAMEGKAVTKESFRVTGFEAVAAQEGAEFKNFDAEGVIRVHVKRTGQTIYVAKPMFEADMVINLPKLKTHTGQVYTCALKNMFGCIPGMKKAEYHKNHPRSADFAEAIVDIDESVNVGLTIVDAVMSMEGDGPTGGTPCRTNKIIIGGDMTAVDMAGAAMIGLESDEVPIIKAAAARNIGCTSIDDIEIVGDWTEIPVYVGFKLPKTMNRLAAGPAAGIALPAAVDFMKVRPVVNESKCKGCNMCVESCPVKAIDRTTKRVNYSICIECMCCHELCLHHAVELKRQNALARMLMGRE